MRTRPFSPVCEKSRSGLSALQLAMAAVCVAAVLGVVCPSGSPFAQEGPSSAISAPPGAASAPQQSENPVPDALGLGSGSTAALENDIRFYYATGQVDRLSEALEKLRQIDPDHRTYKFYSEQMAKGQVTRRPQGRYGFLLDGVSTSTLTTSTASSVAPSSLSAGFSEAPPAVTESHPPPVPMPSVRPLSFMDRVKRSPLPYAGGVVGLIVALFVLRSVLKRRSANAAEAVAAEAAEASAAAAPPGADEPISAEFSLTTETEGPDFFGQMGTEAAPSAGGTSYGDTEPLMSALQGASAQDGLLQTADVSPPTPISLEGVGASGMPESEQFVSADFSEVEAVAGEPPVSADGGVATGEEEGETRVDFGDFFARMGQASGGEEVKPVEDEPPELSSQVFAEQFHGVFLSPEDADSAPAPDSSEMTLPTDDEALDPFSLNGQTAQSEEFDETLFSSQEKTQAHVDLDDTFFHSASQTRAERPAPASPPSSGSADFVVSLDDEMTSSPVGMPIVGGGSGEGSPEAEDAAAGEETLVLSNPDAVARMGLDPAIQERLLSDEQQNLYEDNHRRGCRAFEEHDYHTALKHFRIAQTLRPDNADVANRLAIVQKALRSADTH